MRLGEVRALKRVYVIRDDSGITLNRGYPFLFADSGTDAGIDA